MKITKQKLLSLGWLLFWLAASLRAAADSETTLLYRIDGESAPPSYILGTMHSADPRVLQVLQWYDPVIQASGGLVLEMVPDVSAMLAASLGMLNVGGRGLSCQLGAQLFERVFQAVRGRGIDRAALDKLKPWAVAVMLALPEARGQAMDQVLYHSFLERQKPVYGLETASEQLAIFDRLPEQQQIAMLKETLEQLPQLPQLLERMLQIYVAGDLQGLKRLTMEQQAGSDPVLLGWFEEELLGQRNIRMVAGLQRHLDRGNMFVGVGALHLPGPNGILRLLRDKGYRITPVVIAVADPSPSNAVTSGQRLSAAAVAPPGH